MELLPTNRALLAYTKLESVGAVLDHRVLVKPMMANGEPDEDGDWQELDNLPDNPEWWGQLSIDDWLVVCDLLLIRQGERCHCGSPHALCHDSRCDCMCMDGRIPMCP